LIKYIGSKRRLVPVLGDLLTLAGARRAADLFTGTTRVAQEWKRRGAEVWAVDTAGYAEVLAQCYIGTDARTVALGEVEAALSELQQLPGVHGYVTATFARAARFFQEPNSTRIDAIRAHVEERWSEHPLHPVLLASLLEAADRVDSTTGVQMAYLKTWAPRSFQPLTLRRPVLLDGPGWAVRGDAVEVAATLPEVDLAYLDPPYNQHRYFTNYHVWETLVAWDAPAHYGVACKRIDAKDPRTRSVFNDRRRAPSALEALISGLRAAVVVVSASDEAWVSLDDLVSMGETRGAVRVLAFESTRYIGSKIGIHNRNGEKVGRAGRTSNTEYLMLSGDRSTLDRMSAGYRVIVTA
jgi:adenine-specific DNA-methyltransferase